MPLKFCLPPAEADKFKKELLAGTIDPFKLASMTSAERHTFFKDRFGEAMAGPLNTALEEKLLLKNQQAGMVNWAQRMMAGQKNAQRDVISKIKGMEKLLTPKDEDAFLAELAAHRLGARISYDEAQHIAKLSAAVDTTKASMAAGGDRMEYGRAVVELQNYVGALKRDAKALTRADLKEHPVKTAATGVMRAIKSTQGVSKSILSSFDNSALLRQGLPALLTHPIVWQNNARKSFVDLARAFGSHHVVDEMMAEILSRPTYDLMRQAKLDVGVREEAFPESLPEKIPFVGAPFRASEAAYKGFQTRTRADLFDLYLKVLQKSGVEIDKEQLEALGSFVNGMTGRGHLGSLGEKAAPLLNTLFFSPRNMASRVHILTAHLLDPTATSFTRRQAAINLGKILGAFAIIFGIAKALNPQLDLSPTGPTFGKASKKVRTQADVIMFAMLDALGMSTNTFKHNPTTVDLTGGMGSYVTLGARIAARLASFSKRAMGHSVPKEKRNTWQDVEHFLENKGAPGVQATKSVMQDRTFNGDRPTIGGILKDMVTPMPIQNVIELEQEKKRNSR